MMIRHVGARVQNDKYRLEKEVEILRIKEIRGWRADFRRFRGIPFLFKRNRECRFYLHQDAFEILTHCHAAQFDAEVADLEARSLRLDLRLLFTSVDIRHF